MNKELSVTLDNKVVSLRLTPAAERAIQGREDSLYVEMELYFSCLIRKKVRFYDESTHVAYQKVLDGLHVGFRPVMTQHCSVDATEKAPPVTDFPIARASSFIPRWLTIHYHNGEWQGEFGY